MKNVVTGAFVWRGVSATNEGQVLNMSSPNFAQSRDFYNRFRISQNRERANSLGRLGSLCAHNIISIDFAHNEVDFMSVV